MKIYVVWIKAAPDYYTEYFDVGYFSTMEKAEKFVTEVELAVKEKRNLIHPFCYLCDKGNDGALDIQEVELDEDVYFLSKKSST
jgi:hypothetical protein